MRNKLVAVFVISLFFTLMAMMAVVVRTMMESLPKKPSNETYSVTFSQHGQVMGTITNAILITNCTPHCKAVVYKIGTNISVFHGFLLDVDVKTNKPALEK